MKIVKTLVALLIVVAMVMRRQEDHFDAWLQKHGKDYGKDEYAYRKQIFSESVETVIRHNRLFDQGKTTYRMELNKFADITDEEFKRQQGGLIMKKGVTSKCAGKINDAPNPPDVVDWTKKGTTDVQNQGTCGASWAFAASGALEGLYAGTKGKLIKFSDQQLLDCSDDYGNQGCNGGLMDQAFWYVIDNGVTNIDQYAWVGQDQKCVYKTTMKVMQIKQCADVPSGSFELLKAAVVQQPVAVGIDSAKLRLYKEGVFDGECGNDIDAGILIVGYGKSDDGKDFWKLKNSLGTDWGINGLLLLSMGDKVDGPGKCGVQLLGTIPREIV